MNSSTLRNRFIETDKTDFGNLMENTGNLKDIEIFFDKRIKKNKFNSFDKKLCKITTKIYTANNSCLYNRILQGKYTSPRVTESTNPYMNTSFTQGSCDDGRKSQVQSRDKNLPRLLPGRVDEKSNFNTKQKISERESIKVMDSRMFKCKRTKLPMPDSVEAIGETQEKFKNKGGSHVRNFSTQYNRQIYTKVNPETFLKSINYKSPPLDNQYYKTITLTKYNKLKPSFRKLSDVLFKNILGEVREKEKKVTVGKIIESTVNRNELGNFFLTNRANENGRLEHSSSDAINHAHMKSFDINAEKKHKEDNNTNHLNYANNGITNDILSTAVGFDHATIPSIEVPIKKAEVIPFNSNQFFKNEFLSFRDQIYNKMHCNEVTLKRTDKSILNRNNRIKYKFYKNSKKNLLKEEVIYAEYLTTQKSSRSKSLVSVIKTDPDYLKFRSKELDLFERLKERQINE